MRTAVIALVCLILGLGAGFFMGRTRADGCVPVAASAASSAPIALERGLEVARANVGAANASTRVNAGAQGSAGVKQADIERLRELEAEVARLKGTVAAVEGQRREIEGTPIAFPEGHSPEGDERAFHESLQKALAVRGFEGEVQSLDCSEFPCIAHGVIKKDIDDLTMRAIANDAKATLGWGAPYLSLSRFIDDKNPANSASGFAVAIYPDDLPYEEQQNMNKRLRDRKNAFTDAN